MGMFDGIEGAGKADSEILDAGQRLIVGMRLTTGCGDPERGEPFGHGAARFSGAGETVGSAVPDGDWHGGSAQAYAAANRRQADRSASLAALDRGVQTVIAREAHQISHRRAILEDQADYLGDLSHLTSSMTLIPGVGKAMKSAVEMAAVNAALTVCSVELHQLSREVDENAAQLRQLADEYSVLAEEATVPPDLEDAPTQPPTDEAPVVDRTDRPVPVQAAPSPGAAPPGAPAPAEVAAAQPIGPAEPAAPAVPTEAMSGMASAFGAVGGMIGAMVAPLAAVLTGVAGAAGQSLSALTSSGDADSGLAETPTADSARTPDEDAADDRAGDESEAGEAGPAVPTEAAAESEAPPPPPADKLDQERQSAPPAATRPPH